MSRNETQTCRELIDPALRQAGWAFNRQLELGPGPVNPSGGNMYNDIQRLVIDYLLRLGPLPLAILKAEEGAEPAFGQVQYAPDGWDQQINARAMWQ